MHPRVATGSVYATGERELKKGVRPDALTPTLSHRERAHTLKKATCVAFLLLPWSRTHQRRTCWRIGVLLEVFLEQFRQLGGFFLPLLR